MIKTKVLRPPRVAAASVYCHAVRGRAHRLCLCSSSGGCEKGKRSNIPRGVVGGGGATPTSKPASAVNTSVVTCMCFSNSRRGRMFIFCRRKKKNLRSASTCLYRLKSSNAHMNTHGLTLSGALPITRVGFHPSQTNSPRPRPSSTFRYTFRIYLASVLEQGHREFIQKAGNIRLSYF